jgi:iron complex outermembrane receptor protein
VSELYSEGLHHGSAAIEEGNATLEGERSLKLVVDAEGTWNKDRFRAWLTLYHDRVDGYIYLRPTGYQLTIRGAFPAFEYTATTATLTGIDAMTDLHLRHGLHWRVRASMLRARDEEAGDWLFLMPSDRLTNELVLTMPRYKGMRQLRFSLMSTLVARQTRFPPDVDFTDPPAGYHLVGAGLSTSWPIGSNSLRFGIEAFNLLNTRYRDYLDRFRYFADAPGMDLVVNLRYTFGSGRD